KEIIDFIREYRERRGISPAQREICERFGYSSFGTVQKHIRLLLEKGVLIRDWNKRRSLLVAENASDAGQSSGRSVSVPLYGSIAAGSPIEVTSEPESGTVPHVLTQKGDNYVLRVQGSSMVDEGLPDGDFVVAH